MIQDGIRERSDAVCAQAGVCQEVREAPVNCTTNAGSIVMT